MDYYDSDQIIDILDQAAVLNRLDPLRDGHILVFPDYGQVIMTGDLHGYTDNFKKLVWFANLERSMQRHVILHELIHSTSQMTSDGDPSLLLLIQAAQWKIDYPDQVHFLMGNHDLAQLTDREISKGGAASIKNFNEWVTRTYGQEAGMKILAKLNQFIISMSLAAKCPNRIWLSHSLPSPHAINFFDFSLFSRDWTGDDMTPKGSLYELLWGRNQTADELKDLADILDLDYFIVGHQAQENGYAVVGSRLLILASDHGLGCFMPIDLSRRYKFQELIDRIKFFHDLPTVTGA
jgi:hypothetical protein